MGCTNASHVLIVLCACVHTEAWSEAIKVLKGEYTIRAINEHKMDQAIIFCRTKIDCDNMEQYFIQQGGGGCGRGLWAAGRHAPPPITMGACQFWLWRVVLFYRVIIAKCNESWGSMNNTFVCKNKYGVCSSVVSRM